MKLISYLRLGVKESSTGCRYIQTMTAQDSVQIQNEIFNGERTKQHMKVGRIEKIEVKYLGNPQPCRLFMNKWVSTPYNVAQHMNEWVVKRSALALVNGEQLWDMHRPLESDCQIEFLSFTDSDPYQVNRAFWRTCSFLLGAVVKDAFSPGVSVLLHSFPSPQITSGSFIHDAEVILETDWKPSLDELRSLSTSMLKLASKEIPIERLEVEPEIAHEIFKDNRFKMQQIPQISAQSGGKITLYRVGTHIDISRGPMVANTLFLGRCSIAGVHIIEKEGQKLYRFQGVALPQGLLLNHFAYKIIEERASKLNDKISTSYTERKFKEMAH